MELIAMVIIIAIIIVFFMFVIYFISSDYTATIERAKKIDPTVKNYHDAQFILQKDIAQNIGKNITKAEEKK